MSEDAEAKRRTYRPLEGKTALVTGSSRGIGRSIARRLARDGALVAVHYATREDAALEAVALIEADGGQAFPIGHDLAAGDPVDLVTTLDEELNQRTGRTTLDILVNNAAYANPTAFADTTPEIYDRIFEVNVRAPFFLTQALVDQIPDHGRIVMISSAVTKVLVPGTMPYAMGKSAIEMMSRLLAKELGARRITVNVVAPGVIATELAVQTIGEDGIKAFGESTAFGQVGQVEDVADLVALVVSPDARWMTGDVIDASGSQTLG